MLFYIGFGIYFIIRGIFAFLGKTTFYSKRLLEKVSSENLSPYLQEIGIWQVVIGAIFLIQSALYKAQVPYNYVFFLIAMLICAYYTAKVEEKYKS